VTYLLFSGNKRGGVWLTSREDSLLEIDTTNASYRKDSDWNFCPEVEIS
jgi:hypothetical protein